MDSLTQALLGATITHRIVGKSLGRSALAVGAVLGTLPDLDVLISHGNAVDDFIYHRGFSHSVFVLAAISPIIAWLLYGWYHREEAKLGNPTNPNPLYRHLLFAVLLALITHPLLDSFTSYGTQVLWPLNRPWHGEPPITFSTIFIIDPLYTLPLFAAVIYALFRPHKTKVAKWALFVSSAYLAWTVLATILVKRHTNEALGNTLSDNARYFSAATPFNSLLHRVVIVEQGFYYIGYVSVRDLFSGGEATVSLKRYETDETLKGKLTDKNRVFFDKLAWFSHGIFRLEKTDEGLVFTDLRMGIEDAYVFRFVLQRSEKDGVTTTPDEINVPYKLEPEYDFHRLKAVYEEY